MNSAAFIERHFWHVLHRHIQGLTKTQTYYIFVRRHQTSSLNISIGHWTMIGKNQVMSDKRYFRTEKVVRRETKKIFYK